nr:hypothetical protein [Candidatus Bathyarchaeota archaeon]
MRRVFFIIAPFSVHVDAWLGIVAPILPLYAEQSLGASGIWTELIFAGFGISRTVITPLIGSPNGFTVALMSHRGRELRMR